MLRRVAVESRAVHPQTAIRLLGLAAVLVLLAWFIARVTELASRLVVAAPPCRRDRRTRADGLTGAAAARLNHRAFARLLVLVAGIEAV
jgi:hypothetical protein